MKLFQTLLAGTAFVMATGAAAQMAPQDMPPADDATTTTAPAEGTTPVDEMTAEQTAPTTDAMPMTTAPATTDATVPATAQSANFTDEQIKGFASAALKIQAMSADTTMTDPAAKNAKMAEIVANSGIDVETFNAISAAMDANPEVAERVQMAAAEVSQTAG